MNGTYKEQKFNTTPHDDLDSIVFTARVSELSDAILEKVIESLNNKINYLRWTIQNREDAGITPNIDS
jgi:acetate kinase